MGRSILRARVDDPQSLWNTSTWPAGPYTVEWTGAEGAREVVRLIVTH